MTRSFGYFFMMTSIILYMVFFNVKAGRIKLGYLETISGSSFRVYSNRIIRRDKDSGKHGKVSGAKA